jgi:hypothetical protein
VAGLALALMTALALAAVHAGTLARPAPALYALALVLALDLWRRQREARAREQALSRERELAEAASRAKTERLQVSHEMHAHDAVLGFSDILARTAAARAGALRGAAGPAATVALINDLLDSARMDSGRCLSVHRFNLVDLVELQLELLRERAQAQGLWLRVSAARPPAGSAAMRSGWRRSSPTWSPTRSSSRARAGSRWSCRARRTAAC